MIKKKRSLILELDELRKRINTLEAGAYTAPPALQSGFMPFQQPHPMFPGMPLAMPSPDPYLMMFPGFGAPGMVHGESSHYGTAGPTTFAPRGPASPGSASRRSHAIEIKPPPDEPRKLHVLDPKSPTYEPGMKVSTNLPVAAPPTPSPAKRSTEYSNRVISQNPSLSSIDTTDFFPTNTHEHSTTRVAPNTMMLASQQSSRINVAPETPEKWPNDPWNPPPSNEAKSSSAKRLSSWTGELGKRRSGGQQSSSESPAYPQGLVERHQAEHKALNYRDDSLAPASQQTISSYAPGSAQHGLITFQEGYQAGYEHRNLPANVEYLRGFAEGLAASLNEQKLVAQFTRSQRERDSAVAMEFPESANLENTEVRFRPFSMNPNMADSFHKHTSIRQFSGNQLQTRASPAPSQRYFPKESPLYAADVTMYKVRSAGDRQRMSGLDGAMDDLAELIEETKLTEQDAESAEEASCFKTSGKGKQKASSPNKAAATPTEQPSSPKKSSEHSPAKAKLEKVTNKLRRNNKKEDPQTMSPDEKRSRTEKWRGRFRSLREQENKEIEEYMRNNPRGGCNNPRGGYK
ncbi:hypothetical protein EJ04DRAFT_259558 [Polyplosphaeria fusca]|uniref:Uncharacterized protein n=1 Tax=Polyplosphaeria fusca TaxID=682080 RepID=A0A9P4RBA1_9PLEO|nr:hypothetical protein EJ04DRAFT_259558 [Polyplosphaeria fusca]